MRKFALNVANDESANFTQSSKIVLPNVVYLNEMASAQ